MVSLEFGCPELENFLDICRKHVSHDHGIDYKTIHAESGMLNQTK